MRLGLRTWQDWVTALLGVWVIAQPWVLGYQDDTAAMWANVVAGLLVVLFTFWANMQRTAHQA